MKIYIASSWKNQHGVEMLTKLLRDQGHEVISWVENNYGEGHGANKPINFEEWVKTEKADNSFYFDTEGARNCDIFIYYGPAGKDAAAECGIAYAAQIFNENRSPVMLALYAKGEDFGLMRKMFYQWFDRYDELLKYTSRHV